MKNLDKSGWIEYFGDGPNADWFAPAIEDVEALVVPTMVIYETFKRLLQHCNEEVAMEAVLAMHQGQVVDFDSGFAIEVARLSSSLHLPTADSIILATARRFGATVWTQDAHFEGLPDVRLFSKQEPH